jgi:hypothetical protein
MLLAKEKDFPLKFIAGRNQVNADELGGRRLFSVVGIYLL